MGTVGMGDGGGKVIIEIVRMVVDCTCLFLQLQNLSNDLVRQVLPEIASR